MCLSAQWVPASPSPHGRPSELHVSGHNVYLVGLASCEHLSVSLSPCLSILLLGGTRGMNTCSFCCPGSMGQLVPGTTERLLRTCSREWARAPLLDR